jgi:hypothetical protein
MYLLVHHKVPNKAVAYPHRIQVAVLEDLQVLDPNLLQSLLGGHSHKEVPILLALRDLLDSNSFFFN